MSVNNQQGVVRFIRDAVGVNADAATDGELVHRYAASADEQAFRVLVARHASVVWGLCRRLSRNHHDAEDAFQATFLVLAKRADGIRNSSAIGGWLCGVAARVASRVRSTKRPESTDTEPVVGNPEGELGDLTIREAETALYEELARLPENYRAALVLCCLEGLSRDEAAARLGWTDNQVKNSLEQGRERLRSTLARRGIALGIPILTGLLSPPAFAVPPAVVESAIGYGLGTTSAPAAITSLASGVNRTMWLLKWKWALAGSIAATLTAGVALAAMSTQQEGLKPAPEPPKPVLLVANAPAAAPAPKQELPTEPFALATAYLKAIIDGKPEDAMRFADPKAIKEKHIKELQTAGLKKTRFVAAFMNNARILFVTEKAKLVRRPGATAEDAHAIVLLEREKTDGPWLVRDSDIADEGKVKREIESYLNGENNFKKPTPPVTKDAPEPLDKKEPIPAREVAVQFQKHTAAAKIDQALKLVSPGNISEEKLKEFHNQHITTTTFTVVLMNDRRVELVSDQQNYVVKGHTSAKWHLVLMVTKNGDNWQVKDIDLRDPPEVEPRVLMYLNGRYDNP